jgi:tRNA pseudouridine55 synthase
LAQILCDRLEVKGTLCFLERLNEGKFFYENEKDLNPLDYLDIPIVKYTGTKEWLFNGKQIALEYLDNNDEGKYIILFDDFFSIIEIKDNEVSYLLNKITL